MAFFYLSFCRQIRHLFLTLKRFTARWLGTALATKIAMMLGKKTKNNIKLNIIHCEDEAHHILLLLLHAADDDDDQGEGGQGGAEAGAREVGRPHRGHLKVKHCNALSLGSQTLFLDLFGDFFSTEKVGLTTPPLNEWVT